MEWYSVFPDVRHWPTLPWEIQGRRTKHWRVDEEEQPWLLKWPREGRPLEPVIEAFTLDLAHRLGMKVALGRIVRDPKDSSSYAFISKRFGAPTEVYESAVIAIESIDPEFKTRKDEIERNIERTESDEKKRKLEIEKRLRPLATLDRALTVASARNVLSSFLELLVFDAWIGNSDRHSENWGILRDANGTNTLAPIFDTAACLGVELPDSKLRAINVKNYSGKCRSGFGEGNNANMEMKKVIAKLAKLSEWNDAKNKIVPRIQELMSTLDESLLNAANLLSQDRREFIINVLQQRVILLQ